MKNSTTQKLALKTCGREPRTDRELVRFIGRHGIVSMGNVMDELGVGRTAAYRRVARCIEQGLLERIALLREEPAVLRATRAGLRWSGLGLPLATVSPATIGHELRCVSVAQHLAFEFGSRPILTEREIAFEERAEGRAIASAKLAERPDRGPRLHRPDLAVMSDEGTVAIEVELTPKAPRRLLAIMRAWRRASWVAEVRYCCEPGATRRAVERAVREARCEERILIGEVSP
jgi:hypothetical protein